MPTSKRPTKKTNKKRTTAKKPARTAATSPASTASPKSVPSKITGSYRLFGQSLLVLRRHFKLFLGISLVYALLNVLLVHGLASNGNLQTVKSALNGGSSKGLTDGLTLFVYLLGGSSSSSSASADAGVYQTLLIILVSLALIWALRQVYNGLRPRIRDSFYKGVYPLVPFILVLLVISLQLIPLLIGGFLYSTVISNGIAVIAIEKILWGVLFLALALVSLYLICSSVFALYVVTLPDMTPMKALKSARELVRHRRLTVVRRLLFLPLALLVLAAAIMLPIILFVTPVAEWIYFALSMAALAVIHSYMYALYRELLP